MEAKLTIAVKEIEESILDNLLSSAWVTPSCSSPTVSLKDVTRQQCISTLEKYSGTPMSAGLAHVYGKASRDFNTSITIKTSAICFPGLQLRARARTPRQPTCHAHWWHVHRQTASSGRTISNVEFRLARTACFRQLRLNVLIGTRETIDHHCLHMMQ